MDSFTKVSVFLFLLATCRASFDANFDTNTHEGSGSQPEQEVFICESAEHEKWVKDLLMGYIMGGKLNMFEAMRVNNAPKEQQGFLLADLLEQSGLPQLPPCMPPSQVDFDESFDCGSEERVKWVRNLMMGYIYEGRVTIFDAKKVNDAEDQESALEELLVEKELPPVPRCTSEEGKFVCRSKEHQKWVRDLISGYIMKGELSMFDALKVNGADENKQAGMMEELLRRNGLPPLPECVESSRENEYECGSKAHEEMIKDIVKGHMEKGRMTSYDAFRIKMTPKSMRVKKLAKILQDKNLPPIPSCH